MISLMTTLLLSRKSLASMGSKSGAGSAAPPGHGEETVRFSPELLPPSRPLDNWRVNLPARRFWCGTFQRFLSGTLPTPQQARHRARL
jgi:hypothetical protein